MRIRASPAACESQLQGELRRGGIGYSIPPLWGNASFNAGAGMAKTAYAASYIHDNMPFGITYQTPMLSVQQAWDVAAYIISKPHPADLSQKNEIQVSY